MKKEEQTVKMVFSKDQFFNEECVYTNGIVYDVPVAKKERWLKRGGVILTDAEAKAYEKSEDKKAALPGLLAKDLAKEVKEDGQKELAEDIKADAEGDVTAHATTPEDAFEVTPPETAPIDEAHDGEELEEGEEVEDSKDESGASKKSGGKKSKKAKK